MIKRNEREPEQLTKEAIIDKWVYVYFDNEEHMEQYIKYHKIKYFEYTNNERTIKFPVSELIKEK